MRILCLFTCVTLLLSAASDEPRLKPIFDGKSLKGWKQCNGTAKYIAKDKMITGTTIDGSPNSFLCSEKTYGNFILEFEVKTDPELNSGMQIRSHRYKEAAQVRTYNQGWQDRKHEAGRVYGYQVEIASEKSGASGGIYDEARRGWVDNVSAKQPARSAFKDNQWNKYRVKADGDHMQVWINGVPRADLYDTADADGFLALQVHAYKGPTRTVSWRNIMLAELPPTSWKPMMDGKTMAGWEKSGGGEWEIKDGAFHATADPAIHKTGGYLLSTTRSSNFTFRFKYKITTGNSGLFFRFEKPGVKVEGARGYEVEIDPTRDVGGLQEVGKRGWLQHVEAAMHNDVFKKDAWNEMVISAHGHRIVINVNGVKIVDRVDEEASRLEGLFALQVNARSKLDVGFKDIQILKHSK